jgi:hypothetical protein
MKLAGEFRGDQATARPKLKFKHLAVSMFLFLAIAGCAPDTTAATETVRSIAFSLDFADQAVTTQGVPSGSSAMVVAVRVYEKSVLDPYLTALTSNPDAAEPIIDHPVFGAGVPNRIRFNAQNVESELGGTTLFLLSPSDTLQLSFQALSSSPDLVLAATVFEMDTVGVIPHHYPTTPAIAYGSVELPFSTPGSIPSSISIPLQSLSSHTALTSRVPIDYVYAAREYDFTLSVTLDVSGEARRVPAGDFAATYALSNATLAPSYADTAAARAEGVRVNTLAQPSSSPLSVSVTVESRQAAGTPPVFYRPISFTDSVTLPFGGDGFSFDTAPPQLTVTGINAGTITLTGTVGDEGGSGLAAIRLFDGPRLIASSLSDEVPIVAVNDGVWQAPLSNLDANSGDAYLITVVATDHAGNFSRLSGVINLAAETFTQTEPELP